MAMTDYDNAMAENLMAAPPLSGSAAFWRAISGLVICGISLVLFAVLLSFSPYDHTGDTAGLGGTQNLLGGMGANLSNLMMQVIGVGGYLLAAMIGFVGIRRLLAKPSARSQWQTTGRIALIAGIIFFGTVTLSGFPIPKYWPMGTGLGGWIGDIFYLNFRGALEALNVPLSGFIVTLCFFLAAAFCLARYIGIVGNDFLEIADAAGLVWATFRVRLDQFIGWIGRKINSSYGEQISQGESLERQFGHVPDIAPLAAAPVVGPVTAPVPAPVYQPVPSPTPPQPKAKKRRVPTPKKPEFHFPEGSDFVLPGLDLLKTPPPRMATADPGMLQRQSQLLHRVLEDYGIKGEMGQVSPGPVVTLFEFEPAPGVKSQRVINLSDDIARNMSAESARIAVVPGRNAMGVEMPNRRRETVWLKNMLASETFVNAPESLPLIMGEDIGGAPFVADLAKMPHLLVAGTTGSGKSVAVNAMILSLMYKLTPDQCKFIMIDPKMLELSVYDGAPHLLAPVVTEPKKAVVALKWTVREMEDRYRKMSKMGVRNMAGYNEKVAEFKARGETLTRTVMTGYDKDSGEPVYETEELHYEPMPYIVVIIDEMADLMMVAGKDIEGAVQRLAQMARAAGIHMIMATQRPSVDVITGTIKANFPTRVSFRVGSKIDSRTILGEQGAEQLLGNGDMLFMGTGRPRRYHGPFVSDGEVERVAAFVKAQGSPSYMNEITEEPDEDGINDGAASKSSGGGNELFDQAVAIVARDRKASTSYIQRKLSIGYNRAADLIDRMEDEGMISAAGSGGKREIFLPE
jgi:S-DNA-T family DNA segregation ATPase FtsK/SpoIIIE